MGKEEMTPPNRTKSVQYENTPHNVIANASRFNKQFLDLNLGGNPTTVNIGKMLTVMSEQDNTIRVLSRLLGRDYNEQHLHDMHNSLFGSLAEGPKSSIEGMHVVNILNQLTTFIHEQNQQIQVLIDKIRNSIKHI
jgi:hypothetical protein